MNFGADGTPVSADSSRHSPAGDRYWIWTEDRCFALGLAVEELGYPVELMPEGYFLEVPVEEAREDSGICDPNSVFPNPAALEELVDILQVEPGTTGGGRSVQAAADAAGLARLLQLPPDVVAQFEDKEATVSFSVHEHRLAGSFRFPAGDGITVVANFQVSESPEQRKMEPPRLIVVP
ncbi:hypothetical protein GIS00_10790 [Nakamurella sp. YIM 132087]|uniref:Uncharacterized protein n=1 Tax=Nakamurella alba TaxID=2665158 RepID=A0A7K1FK24_9ACTN|nr:hypothetical protein [Nakamurella alba]MTD14436.1 hypothetical protein [Nakamurella alba]